MGAQVVILAQVLSARYVLELIAGRCRYCSAPHNIFFAMLGLLMGRRMPVLCESTPETHPAAFPEHTKQVPLTPKMDKAAGYGKYKKYEETMGPFPEALEFANQLKITEEQVNQTYEHNLSLHTSLDGNAKPTYSSGWEKAVAYHYGLYVPETYTTTKTADDIRIAVANFEDKVHKDAPKDACKYLQIEEFRCLQTYQFEVQ